MKIRLKLFAGLGRHLPPGVRRDAIDPAVEVDAPEGTTVAAVLAGLGVPRESVKLVFIDGVHQFPGDLEYRPLEPGETLAVWPPVAGG